MSDYKEYKFKVGDVVKLVDIDGLYSSENVYNLERLELNKDYPVYSVEDNGEFIKLIKDSGETEGVFSYRLIHAEPEITAESLRNSILSLQQQRVSLQEQIEQNIAQEKSLTEQLKELGFLLIESKEQITNVVDEKKSVLYAEDIEEDMTDYRNWERGDVLEVITHDNPRVPFGALVKHDDRDGDGSPFTKSEYSSKWAIDSEYLKFHSRPVKN